jgi:uncharacterized membrane protein|tara:strand:- start:54 stop:419 length:366 start_codon:yes stop_codon:yes gene_type:complete
MKTYQANLFNSLTLIAMCLWAFLSFESVDGKEQNMTALIPLFLGLILLLCNNGLKKENKITAHVAVMVTLIAIIGVFMKPFLTSIEEGRSLGIFRTSLMLLTSVIAMISFIKSFIAARKKS